MTENQRSVYLSVRIKNYELASDVQDRLEQYGIKVFNPCSITPNNIAPENIPEWIADACYKMIDDSDCVVLLAGDGSDFGNDCSAELGYTKASNKPAFIFITTGDVESGKQKIQEVLPIHSGDFPNNVFVTSIENLVQLIN